jgi:hypothetical protein
MAFYDLTVAKVLSATGPTVCGSVGTKRIVVCRVSQISTESEKKSSANPRVHAKEIKHPRFQNIA